MRDHVRQALEAIEAGSPASSLETSILDFKTVGRSKNDAFRDLAEAAMCFANSQGGTIVVGVRDNPGGRDAFVGCPLTATRTVERIYDLTDPGLIVIADEMTMFDAQLLVLTVPRSPDIHQVGKTATERVGTSCVSMTASRIATVLADRRGDDWSAKESSFRLDDASAGAIELARQLLSSSVDPERSAWSRMNWPDLARRLGVDTGGQLTNGGAVLFCDTGRIHAQYIRRTSAAGLLSENVDLTGPGLSALQRLFDLIAARTQRTSILLPNGAQLLIGDLPDGVAREALVNAFMHRDYRSGGPILVEHESAHLKVTSPGGFVPGVSVDNVLTVSSRTRNLSLSRAIRGLGLAESAGVGVDRMYASMAAAGFDPPSFATDGSTVAIELRGGTPSEPISRFVAGLMEDQRSDPDTLLTMTYLLTHRTTNAETMSPILQKRPEEVEHRLLELSAPGSALIERTAETTHSRYGEYRLVGDAIRELGSAIGYRARSGDDTDRKIIAIVREFGMIKGRIVQTMFDVQPATASRILSDLVDRRVLVKTSRATRGPSVTYGPGPKFPAASSRATARNSTGAELGPDSATLELGFDEDREQGD